MVLILFLDVTRMPLGEGANSTAIYRNSFGRQPTSSVNMDRQRITQWLQESSKDENLPRLPPVVVQTTIKPKIRTSAPKPSGELDPHTLLAQGQLAIDIGINRLVNEAETTWRSVFSAGAALIPSDRSEEISDTASGAHPSTAMLFNQYEKSRRFKSQTANALTARASTTSSADTVSRMDCNTVRSTSLER